MIGASFLLLPLSLRLRFQIQEEKKRARESSNGIYGRRQRNEGSERAAAREEQLLCRRRRGLSAWALTLSPLVIGASSSSSSFASTSFSDPGGEEESQREQQRDLRATAGGLGVAEALLLRSTVRSMSRPNSFESHARHYSSSPSSRGGADQPPTTTKTTTATSIAEALRLAPNSLKRLDLSDGSADLRCVNLLCERVGGSCVCRLSLALQRVAERQGASLAELSLASNGIEELPRGVFEFFGGEDDDDDGKRKSKPCFRALRRIDLSGNPGLKEVCGVGRGEAMPALREVVVDRGVRLVVVEEEEEGKGVEVVEV